MYSTFVILLSTSVAFSSCGPPRIRAASGGSGTFSLLQDSAECRGGQMQVCRNNCPEVNRQPDGVRACFERGQQDDRCGDKWFEVGNNKCYCYPKDWSECDVMTDGGEDLYQIEATTPSPPPTTTPAATTTPAPPAPTTPAADVHNQCDDLESWCTAFNKETDCCSSTIQTSCPSLCHTCPARHCKWNDWVEGECSASCGVGTRDNTRTKSVVEANGGTCTGQPTETVECKIKECPIPCEWSEWTVGECSKACGGGKHTKTRTETVQAEHGGEECDAEHSTIEESCNVQECPVDCEWSTWTTGQCSKTCGGGRRTDTRLKHVEAQFGGEECVGDASQQVSCNTDECAVCRTKDDKDSVTGMPPNPNVPCHFPFNWNGKTYNECTTDDHDQKWCGTQADVVENATSLLEYGVTEGWGHCEETEICGHVAEQPVCERKYNGYYSYGDCGSQNEVQSFEECCRLTKERQLQQPNRGIIRFSWNGHSCAFKCGGTQDNRGGSWWSSTEDISTCQCGQEE